MRRRVTLAVFCLLAACLGGCEGLESQTDKQAKAKLSGVWFAVTEEPDEGSDKTVTVHSWLALKPDGHFTEKLRGLYPDGRILESGADGEWLITEDLFKLRYVAIEGKNLRRHDLNTMQAFKLIAMGDNEFTYGNPLEPKGRPLTLRRVQEIGKEP